MTEAPLFVGVLGASGLTFAVAKESRELRHWFSCHIEMYEYFGGVHSGLLTSGKKQWPHFQDSGAALGSRDTNL